MNLSQEDIVTRLLSKREILRRKNYEESVMYSINPRYDLTHYLKTAKPEPSRWGEKYVFVK